MKLIFIYGPPASGKLTIAQELVKLTEFNLYHNHLAVDLVESLFDRNKYKQFFFSLIADVNLFMLSKAATQNIPGVVMTSCYIHPDEEGFINQLINTITKHQGEVYFIQITCDEAALKKRVIAESRKKFGKLRDPDTLISFLREKNLRHKIEHDQNLSINNTNLSARKVAQRIKEHFDL